MAGADDGEKQDAGWGRWLVVALPYAWLLVLFLIPFLIVLKISFSTPLIARVAQAKRDAELAGVPASA